MAPQSEPPDVSGRRLLFGSALAAVLTGAMLLATSSVLPMGWDEGNAVLRAEAIPWQWQYTTQHEGHPALYGIVIAAGHQISSEWLSPLDAARFGPMILFALAAGAMFCRIGHDYTVTAGAAAVVSLLLLPRVFAHAHFASIDGPLTSCWILAWASFLPASRGLRPGGRWRSSIVWGAFLGLTLSTKATGWIAPIPFVVWTVVYRDRSAAKTLAIGIPLALLVFFLCNPPLWHDTLRGWGEFFQLNLNRAERLRLDIPVAFLGRSHHFGDPLPWYNTLLWTVVTVPVGILAFSAIGLAAVARRFRSDRAGMLLVGNWLVLLIVRALPMVPPHDGVRLFLPSFAFLAGLAGIGTATVIARAGRPRPANIEDPDGSAKGTGPRVIRWHRGNVGDEPRGVLVVFKPGIGRLLMLATVASCYVGSAVSLYWYSPQWLSYYNLLIGGLPGAAAAGMEPTYYWDALDHSTLDWLNDNTREGENVWFGSPSAENLTLLRRWGILEPGTQFAEGPGGFRWYVLQHRPGPWPWHPIDPWLIEHCHPVYRKTIGHPDLRAELETKPRVAPLPWQLDAPLVEVYDYREYVRAALHRRDRDVPWPWQLDVPLVEVYDYRDFLRAQEATAARDIRPETSP